MFRNEHDKNDAFFVFCFVRIYVTMVSSCVLFLFCCFFVFPYVLQMGNFRAISAKFCRHALIARHINYICCFLNWCLTLSCFSVCPFVTKMCCCFITPLDFLVLWQLNKFS